MVRLKRKAKPERMLPMAGIVAGLGLAVAGLKLGDDWLRKQVRNVGSWLVDRGER